MGSVSEPSNPRNPFVAHKRNHWSLIERFLTSEVDARHFVRQFLKLWKKDRDAQWALKEQWDEPYDEQLQAALQRKDITHEEFQRRWNELWGSPSEQDAEFLDMLDRIMSACDSFDDEPGVEAVYDEARLRRFVAQTFSAYVLTLSDTMAASR